MLIKCGIPQESIIGSVSYLIYVNDIFNFSNLIKCLLYADDTVLIISCDNIATLISNASEYFAIFSKWFSDKKLALYAKKTKFVLFTASNKLLNDCQNELHFDIQIANELIISIIIQNYFVLILLPKMC